MLLRTFACSHKPFTQLSRIRHLSRHSIGSCHPYTDHMAVLMTAAAPTGTSGYTLLIADDASQVEAAQRLRHDVFAGELGARLTGAVDGRDVDEFDDVLRPPDRARRRDRRGGRHLPDALPARRPSGPGRRYGDGEFDLSTAATRCATSWSRPDAPACTPTTAPAP